MLSSVGLSTSTLKLDPSVLAVTARGSSVTVVGVRKILDLEVILGFET
ncbi:MAG: hypothetical protein HYT09_02315, partial [Candidatus Levybacteria bacterium]|nr:hypothetical protein [Candidatus Levybacteria bacterium]